MITTCTEYKEKVNNLLQAKRAETDAVDEATERCKDAVQQTFRDFVNSDPPPNAAAIAAASAQARQDEKECSDDETRKYQVINDKYTALFKDLDRQARDGLAKLGRLIISWDDLQADTVALQGVNWSNNSPTQDQAPIRTVQSFDDPSSKDLKRELEHDRCVNELLLMVQAENGALRLGGERKTLSEIAAEWEQTVKTRVNDIVYLFGDLTGTAPQDTESFRKMFDAPVLRTNWNAPPCQIRIVIVEGAQNTNVGQRIRLKAEVVGPGSITSLIWHIQGTAINSYVTTINFGRKTKLTQHFDLTSNPVEFYWIDDGTKTVQVDVVVGGLQCSASMTFTVIRPRVHSFAAVTGDIDVTPVLGYMSLHFGVENFPGISPGITWYALVDAAYGGDGSVAFLQLVNPDMRWTRWAGVGELQTTSRGKFHLDRADLSNFHNVFYGDQFTPIVGGVPVTLESNDSPRINLTGAQESSMNLAYKLYIMYRPTGPGNIWVSLARLDWGWCARATLNAEPKWVLTGPSWSYVHPFVNTAELPEWLGRAQSLPQDRGRDAQAPVSCPAQRPPPEP